MKALVQRIKAFKKQHEPKPYLEIEEGGSTGKGVGSGEDE